MPLAGPSVSAQAPGTNRTQPQAELQILAGPDVQAALPQECIAPVHGAGA